MRKSKLVFKIPNTRKGKMSFQEFLVKITEHIPNEKLYTKRRIKNDKNH